MPRPPETTMFASGNKISPVAFSVDVIFVAKSASDNAGL
jgi:hypothetical protein